MPNLEATNSPAGTTPDYSQRRTLAYILMSAIVPFVALMATIVVIRFPPWWMIVATVLCWMVFFAGKSILKGIPAEAGSTASDD